MKESIQKLLNDVRQIVPNVGISVGADNRTINFTESKNENSRNMVHFTEKIVDFDWCAFRDLPEDGQYAIKKMVYEFLLFEIEEETAKNTYTLPWSVKGYSILNTNRLTNAIVYLNKCDSVVWKNKFTKKEIEKIEKDNNIPIGTHIIS